MRFPHFLPDKGVLGFIAPSFGCTLPVYKISFENALQKFKTLGFSVDLGPNCYASDGVGISSTPVACAKEFQSYYTKDSVDVLMSCGGGELMCEILEYIDFDRIKKAEPKWFMGYSDNTNLTFLLTTICDVASIYGPNTPSFGMEPWHVCLEDTLSLIKGQKLSVSNYDKWEIDSLKDEEHPLVPYHTTEPMKFRCFPEVNAKMEGRLIGGTLDCLGLLVGTRYDYVSQFVEKYKEDGIIWFIESCDLNMVSIRRALWQLDQAGWFRYVKGFLIGRPMHYGEIDFMDQYEAVIGILQKKNVPIIMDLDIGHLPPQMPLICGSYAKVEADIQQNQVFIQMELK